MVSFNPTLTAALVALYISSAVALPSPDGRFNRPGGRFGRPPFNNNNNQNQNTNTNINTNVNNNANSNFGGRYGGRHGGYGRFGGFGRPPVAVVDKRDLTSDDGIDHALPGVPLAGYTVPPADDDSGDDDDDDDDGGLAVGGVDTDQAEDIQKRGIVYRYGYPRRYGRYGRYGVYRYGFPPADQEIQDDAEQADLQKRGIVYSYGYPKRYGRYGVYRYGFPPADQQIQDDYQDTADVQDSADTQDSTDVQDSQDAQDNVADSQELDKRDFYYRYGSPRRYVFPPEEIEDEQQDQDQDEQQDQDQEQTGGLQKRRRFRYRFGRYGYPRRFGRFGTYRFPPAEQQQVQEDMQKRDIGVGDDEGQQDEQQDGQDLDKRGFFFRYAYPRRFGRYGGYRVFGFPPAAEAQDQKQE